MLSGQFLQVPIMVASLTVLLFLANSHARGQDTENLLLRTFRFSPKLLHHPPSPFLKGRPHFLELVVAFPEDSLESVTLFLKTERSVEYQEINLEEYHGIYRFKYDPVVTSGDTLSYFFVVATKDFGLYATPLDDQGHISPIEIIPVDAERYYKRKRR